MPWHVSEQNGRYCVQKSGGETLKCYDSKEEAARYVRALYANVHEGLSEFSMAIVKANVKDGEMRWRSVNSDIDEDVYGERMSKELFEDFIQHIENNEPIPEQFRSVIAEDEWNGGMPYLSIAHYRTGRGRVNVPGEPKNIYLDGNALKSTGVLYDTPLGKAVFKSLQKDLVEKRDDKIRISIGFLDLEHSHGDRFTFTRKSLTDKCRLCKEGVGDKIYKKGHLVHLALTRVPANPRTDMEVERSMTTKREDAESIIEDEEVLKGLDLKSQAEDVLIIKSDESAEENTGVSIPNEPVSTEQTAEATEQVASTPSDTPEEKSVAVEPQIIAEVRTFDNTPLERSLAFLRDRVEVVKSQGLTGENALREIQSSFEEVGNVLRAEFEPKPTPEQVAAQTLEVTLRSLLGEMLPQAISQAVAPIQSEVSELRALSLATKAQPRKEEQPAPQPRGLQLTLAQKSAIEAANRKVDGFKSFSQIAKESVGL